MKNPASAQGAGKTAGADAPAPGDADAAKAGAEFPVDGDAPEAEEIEAWLADGTAWESAFGGAGDEGEGAGASGCPCSLDALEPDTPEPAAESGVGATPVVELEAT